MKSVGIDIGSFSIKIAEVEASGKNAGAILAFHEHTINPDPRADRQLEIVEILRNIATQYDKASTRFVVGIPQQDISARLKAFPFKERPKILKSLPFELEDDIPLDPDDTIFEAKICEILGEGAQVLAMACPAESVSATLERFRDGGIDPDVVTAEALALANCFERWDLPPPQLPASARLTAAHDTTDGGDEKTLRAPQPPAEGRLVLSIGHTRTLLLAYREGTLIAARSILWGGVEVADALARTFSVPYVEAVRILQKKSFILMSSVGATRDQIVLSTAVSKEVDTLVREVRLTVLDLKTEFNVHFTGVDLLGGTSQIQNLVAYLTQSLEIPANLYRQFQHHKLIRAEPSAATEAISAVAIGLAIEGIKKPRNPAANFRKAEFALQNKSLQETIERWRPMLVTVGIAYLLFNIFAFSRDWISDDLVTASDDAVAAQATALGLKRKSASGLETHIRDLNKQIQARRTLAKLDSYVTALDVLKSLAKELPVGLNVSGVKFAMDIKRLNIDNDLGFIEGRVSNQAQVDTVKAALESISVPKSVKAGTPTSPRPGAVPFAFEFKLNRTPQ
ncbi:MAG: pilus assembly protein PilM [Bdellovibrionaceae bacterium]|nr:pilus assembly protein PilM [Pseudobdellovibrionaceae bacterium]